MTTTLAGVRVLALDDDAAAVSYLVDELTALGAIVDGETDPAAALARVDAGYDVLVSDIEMPTMRGVELVEAVVGKKAAPAVILVTAFGSIDLAVEALRRGAADFITKPFRLSVLAHAIDRAHRQRALEREVVRLKRAVGERAATRIVQRSEAMHQTIEIAQRASASDASVLLTGPSGTGKSRLARFVHESSARAAHPFVTLNCAAVPSSLLEAELFGVRRGAFTGAAEDRPGLFVEAQKGTLFLDEIGDLSIELQPKLLHAIEARQVRPVGARAPVDVDVRIVAATNVDLDAAMRQGRFRQDLYFRLNVVTIEVPPLSARRDDIAPLIDEILRHLAQRQGRQPRGIASDAVTHLVERAWPGNVRELANILERALALSTHDVLTLAGVAGTQRKPPVTTLAEAARARASLAEIEHAYATLVVEEVGGNMSEAARILRVDRRTLQKKLEPPDGS